MLELLNIQDWATGFGMVAAALSVIAYLPYMIATLKGHTRPHRACWFIWSVLASIAFFSQLYEGANTSLGFAGAQALCTTMVFLLSLVRGQGTVLARQDWWVLAVAALGVVVWYMTKNAAYALGVTIAISLLGGALTVQKTFYFPHSETMSTWVMSFVAACFALASVGQADWVLLAYPAYLFVLNGAILLAWWRGRQRGWAASEPTAPVQSQFGTY